MSSVLGFPQCRSLAAPVQGRRMRGRPVSRILSGVAPWMTIPLGLRSPAASSRQPGHLGAKLPCRPPFPVAARHPYSALLPVGLAVPVLLPVPRWALTPPFHPYPCEQGRSVLCGAFPGVAPAGRYPAPLLHGVRTFLGRPAIRKTELWAAAVIRSSAPGPDTPRPGQRSMGALPPYPRDIWSKMKGRPGLAFILPKISRGEAQPGGRAPLLSWTARRRHPSRSARRDR